MILGPEGSHLEKSDVPVESDEAVGQASETIAPEELVDSVHAKLFEIQEAIEAALPKEGGEPTRAEAVREIGALITMVVTGHNFSGALMRIEDAQHNWKIPAQFRPTVKQQLERLQDRQ